MHALKIFFCVAVTRHFIEQFYTRFLIILALAVWEYITTH